MYLTWFFINEYNEIEKEMDWPSYIIAKTAKLYLPRPFPHNNTFAITLLRNVHELSQRYDFYSETKKYPELSTIPTIDLMIPVDKEGTTIHIRIYNHKKEGKRYLFTIFVVSFLFVFIFVCFR
jgi:hypothetical protein